MTNVNEIEESNIQLIKHYIKDLSFENPQSVQENNLENNRNNNITQNISLVQTSYKNNFFSVLLKYSCDCSSKKTGNKLLVLELDYFGFFKILDGKSYNQAVLTKGGAKLILPFVRSIIEDVTNKGGSIKITLKDIDFDLVKN